MIDLKALQMEHFAGREGQRFQVVAGDGEEAELELTEVMALAEHDSGERQVRARPFSLLFRGPREPVLEQRLRQVRHPELGEMPIFLVPIDQDSRGTVYEAVFT